jgi:hypothetical protein
MARPDMSIGPVARCRTLIGTSQSGTYPHATVAAEMGLSKLLPRLGVCSSDRSGRFLVLAHEDRPRTRSRLSVKTELVTLDVLHHQARLVLVIGGQ